MESFMNQELGASFFQILNNNPQPVDVYNNQNLFDCMPMTQNIHTSIDSSYSSPKFECLVQNGGWSVNQGTPEACVPNASCENLLIPCMSFDNLPIDAKISEVNNHIMENYINSPHGHVANYFTTHSNASHIVPSATTPVSPEFITSSTSHLQPKSFEMNGLQNHFRNDPFLGHPQPYSSIDQSIYPSLQSMQKPEQKSSSWDLMESGMLQFSHTSMEQYGNVANNDIITQNIDHFTGYQNDDDDATVIIDNFSPESHEQRIKQLTRFLSSMGELIPPAPLPLPNYDEDVEYPVKDQGSPLHFSVEKLSNPEQWISSSRVPREYSSAASLTQPNSEIYMNPIALAASPIHDGDLEADFEGWIPRPMDGHSLGDDDDVVSNCSTISDVDYCSRFALEWTSKESADRSLETGRTTPLGMNTQSYRKRPQSGKKNRSESQKKKAASSKRNSGPVLGSDFDSVPTPVPKLSPSNAKQSHPMTFESAEKRQNSKANKGIADSNTPLGPKKRNGSGRPNGSQRISAKQLFPILPHLLPPHYPAQSVVNGTMPWPDMGVPPPQPAIFSPSSSDSMLLNHSNFNNRAGFANSPEQPHNGYGVPIFPSEMCMPELFKDFTNSMNAIPCRDVIVQDETWAQDLFESYVNKF